MKARFVYMVYLSWYFDIAKMNEPLDLVSEDYEHKDEEPGKISSKKSAKKRHTCDICSKDFSRKDHLDKHKFIHLDSKPFSCEVIRSSTVKELQNVLSLKLYV